MRRVLRRGIWARRLLVEEIMNVKTSGRSCGAHYVLISIRSSWTLHTFVFTYCLLLLLLL